MVYYGVLWYYKLHYNIMDNIKPKCAVCKKPAFGIYKHPVDNVYFCCMACVGKYKKSECNTSQNICNQTNLNIQDKNPS